MARSTPTSVPRAPTPEDPLKRLNEPFDRMFSEEISRWVSRLPKYQGKPPLSSPDHPDPRNGLLGVAMSGGGMRSATFNLGVAQALARYNLMSHADYLSTVSGGGYLGASLTSLCAEDLPYPPESGESGRSRLDMTSHQFPYAFPGPFAEKSSGDSISPEVHGLESPATRHVRERSRLIVPAAGLFQVDTWASISRYLLSTAALWVLFLLPMTTLFLLPAMLIPDEVWHRASPFTAGLMDPAYSLGNHPWVITAPLWFFGLVALVTLLPLRNWLRYDRFYTAIIRCIQVGSILGMAASTAAVGLVLGIWGYSAVLEAAPDWGVALAGGGSAGAAAGSLRGLLNLSEGIRRTILNLLFAFSGYLALAVGVVAWHFVLWNGWDPLWGWQGFGESLDGYWILWAALAILVGFSWALAPWLLNTLSLNRLYEHRIQRAWIVAATPGRAHERQEIHRPERGWSRVWERPDLRMGNIARPAEPEWRPTSPYPLICAALNLPGSTSPKLLDRKSESFVIGPVYSGSALTRWTPTGDLPVFRRMSLARAAAISAAAASPNMGFRTNITLSVATTIFNARLGWWVRNPRPNSDLGWGRWLPPPLLYWLEMFGQASHNNRQVYLSDGGHFENLGLYELLRRRCKYIISVDGTGEPPVDQQLNFNALGMCLRRARIDFGVVVDIDLRPMMRNPATGHVGSYFAVGAIRYPRQDGHGGDHPSDEDTGILVFVKGGIVDAAESPDLISYHRGINPSFPHDSTADQQFDEAQFESYRELGFLAGQSVCRQSDEDAEVGVRFQALYDYYQTLPREPASSPSVG